MFLGALYAELDAACAFVTVSCMSCLLRCRCSAAHRRITRPLPFRQSRFLMQTVQKFALDRSWGLSVSDCSIFMVLLLRNFTLCEKACVIRSYKEVTCFFCLNKLYKRRKVQASLPLERTTYASTDEPDEHNLQGTTQKT